MSELEKATYDRGFYNGIREARQVFAKHLNVSTSTDEIKWDNVSKTDILSEIDDFLMKNQSYYQPQLTIPKSIAEKANKTDLDKIYCFGAQEFYWLFGHEHDKYVPIIFAYLAGKALGVDLVKVVADENI